MIIEKGKVATIYYNVTDMKGNVLESSEKNGELTYLHGNGFLAPGMEEALSGRKSGDSVDTEIKSRDAFGEYEEAMIFNIARKDFNISDDELKTGLEFQAEIKGDLRFCRVEKIEGETITINANHPYAGVDIRFEAEVREVRDATPEELSHAHAHEHGCGCEHDCGCGDDDCGCDEEEGCDCGCGH